MSRSITSVLVIGSGPIVIGQACEFDYSGTSACRVLKDEGIRVILVNSNPATIMTDPDFADATYVEPLTVPVLEKIIAKERPDALLATLGGQTALNLVTELGERGVFVKYGVKLIGADLEAIKRGENREEFKKVVAHSGAESAKSLIAHTLDECKSGVEELGGYPVVVRPSFTMGGLGSGIAHDDEDLERIVGLGLQYSPTTEVLLEESLIGWKEYELEMMRDDADNVVVVCTIENFDPVGVHTGDSITVAPAMTLTDREFQKLRDISVNIIRKVGVDTGGCNIQFAVHPDTGRIIVIEMNPRVSRSSALASKATGFPIAKIATKLAIGYTLDQIKNDITLKTPASFEPTLDYVVVKVPRFAFEKFPAADDTLTTTMKSVGEVMATGRNFAEALQKAMRSLDNGKTEFSWDDQHVVNIEELEDEICRPTADRLLKVQVLLNALLNNNGSDDARVKAIARVNEATGIDPWFLEQIYYINCLARKIRKSARTILKYPERAKGLLKHAKQNGFSDKQIAKLLKLEGVEGENRIRKIRQKIGVRPVFKAVDTCAAEFDANTPYYYSSYDFETEVCARTREAIIILGSGPNRVGQGIEFDYSCVHAALELSQDFETIMINCNPETVSTDYDTSNRLYFEPLTFEDVMEIYEAELKIGPVRGMIVQLGGQAPLALAARLKNAGVPIIGTSPEAIDAAENREVFGAVLKQAGLLAPDFAAARTYEEAFEVADKIGFPVLVRPSYVLGGRGMEIVYDQEQLSVYVVKALENAQIMAHDRAALPSPLLIDKFLDDAMEIDVDALFDGEELYLGGIMEHIEEAGIHSGDSACVLPPVTLSRDQMLTIRDATLQIARGVGVQGLINVQFALYEGLLYVIEANPRASRTIPFVSKATGISLAKAAVRVMLEDSIKTLRECGYLKPTGDGIDIEPGSAVAVKEAVLPFKRFKTEQGQVVDSLLGPEMRSTGEVMGFDMDFPHAFAKAQEAVLGRPNDTSGDVFLSIADKDKKLLPMVARKLEDIGFVIYATAGTKKILDRNSIPSIVCSKISGKYGGVIKGAPTAVDLINNGGVTLIINTPSGQGARTDGYEIRAAATAADIPVITTIRHFAAAADGFFAAKTGDFSVMSLQEHHALQNSSVDDCAYTNY
ncbi:MAG: carbamoyl-phosphate synthase large subunit [Candidatus Ancillula trichonymphae]|nr:carbamoyl-phosphate synthase large subunit [Candidatus Ancillula trichonymphae]